MTKIRYEPLRFQAHTLAQIEQANTIIAEYQAAGYSLTLRQLYYQFVARDLLQNTIKNYKRLGSTISKARRAGLVDWEAIVDRTRMLRGPATRGTPAEIALDASYAFKHDRWATQPRYIEVWFEKDALLSVFERACGGLRLPFFSCRGYASDSELWSAAQRLADQRKPTLILHFGDHDPSGLDMTRDIENRLFTFGAPETQVQRLALNMDQVEEYEPPPNPAKETDSRFAAYKAEHGSESWELDALDPKVLAGLVMDAVEVFMDLDAWNEAVRLENIARVELATIAKQYPALVKKLKRGGFIQRQLTAMELSEDVRLEEER